MPALGEYPQSTGTQQGFSLYQAFLDARARVNEHKWLESEKAGHDIGYEGALTDWAKKHHGAWRKSIFPQLDKDASPMDHFA